MIKISKSKTFRSEYCAAVVRVGKLYDIEGADNLKKTVIDGFDVVVNKNDVQDGDLMIYCKNETQLNGDFCTLNSMYEDPVMNVDHEKRGYLNKHGRVKMITLRKCPSYGLLMSPKSLLTWARPDYSEQHFMIGLESLIQKDEYGNDIPFEFDEFDGQEFIRCYVPQVQKRSSSSNSDKRNKRVKKFDKMIPGEFSFHYDTGQLNSNMWRIHPDDKVCISVKMHGTSFIIGNVLTKHPLWSGWYTKVFSRLPKFLQFTNDEYEDIYSSRAVIKNGLLIGNVGSGYYEDDIWGHWWDILRGKIAAGVTIYGEIVGFTPNGQAIQKGYDYACSQRDGESKLMIYRVNYHNGDVSREFTPDEVVLYTKQLIQDNPELEGKVIELPVLFRGSLDDLYKDLPKDDHWHEDVLARLKKEGEFGMEEDEPMCLNKVPREGIVVRFENTSKEAFKLKCDKFMKRESKQIDAGEVDVEMSEGY